MEHLWIPDIPLAEKILRSVVVYVFLLIAFRFTGKRQVGSMTPFDLVVLLIISNVVQNAVIGSDNSLGGGLIGAVAILMLNWGVVELTYRYKGARRVLEGEPSLLVHNGKILKGHLDRERISMDDLEGALRKSGVVNASEVRFAVLEENGQISVIPKSVK